MAHFDEASHGTSVDQLIDQGRISKTQLWVIAAALILNMLDGFDIIAMSFTAHSIGSELQISPDRIGILFSVALAGMMLGAMFIAPFSDIIGRRKMLMICVTAIGASVYLTGHATSLWQIVVLRAIAGLGVGSMLASLAAITSEYTPIKYRSLTVTTITAGYPLGATMGGFLVAPMIPEHGWQIVFFVGGLATLAMVPAIYFAVPESIQYLVKRRPANALQTINQTLSKMGKQTLDALPEQQDDEIEKANVFSLLSKTRRVKTIYLWSAFFFCFISLYFMMSWIPKLIVNWGLSEAEGVYASVAFNGGAVVGIITLGWLSSRLALSKLIGSFLSAAGLLMIIFAMLSQSLPLLTSLLVIGLLLQGGFTGLYAVAAKIYPTEMRATGVGWAIGLGRFGAVVGPYVGGLLIAGGISMEINFIIFAAPLIIAGLLAYKLAVR